VHQRLIDPVFFGKAGRGLDRMLGWLMKRTRRGCFSRGVVVVGIGHWLATAMIERVRSFEKGNQAMDQVLP